MNLLEDLKRRDFTINAMAYNESRGLVDAFDGMGDLQKKVIRCVGNPKERFTEDALRMLRALRFAAQLGFEVEEQTFAAIRELAQTIEKISAERIQTELVKLLTSDHPELIREVYTSGISDVILPEFSVFDADRAEQSASLLYGGRAYDPCGTAGRESKSPASGGAVSRYCKAGMQDNG